VLLDAVSGKKGRENDGSDQKRDHPVHVTHFFPFQRYGSGTGFLGSVMKAWSSEFYPFEKKMQEVIPLKFFLL